MHNIVMHQSDSYDVYLMAIFFKHRIILLRHIVYTQNKL